MPWAGARPVQASEEAETQHSNSVCSYRESSWWAGASSFLRAAGPGRGAVGAGCFTKGPPHCPEGSMLTSSTRVPPWPKSSTGARGDTCH